jgi:hypothetical protein
MLLSDKVSRALADSNRMIEESISGAAANLGDGGREAGGAIKEAGDGLVSGLLGAVRQLNAAADRLQNIKVNATVIGAQAGNRTVNADTGRTFPPGISKPGGGGW